MTAGDSKAATTIKRPALVSSPQSRPAPTSRALPSNPAAQRGQNWKPMRGQIWEPIDTHVLTIQPSNNRQARERQERLIERWSPQSQIKVALSSADPHRFCGEILDALAKL